MRRAQSGENETKKIKGMVHKLQLNILTLRFSIVSPNDNWYYLQYPTKLGRPREEDNESKVEVYPHQK